MKITNIHETKKIPKSWPWSVIMFRLGMGF